jgi:hypothetical protein
LRREGTIQLTLAGMKARIEGLDRLARGLAKEVMLHTRTAGVLLFRERKQYLVAAQDAPGRGRGGAGRAGGGREEGGGRLNDPTQPPGPLPAAYPSGKSLEPSLRVGKLNSWSCC